MPSDGLAKLIGNLKNSPFQNTLRSAIAQVTDTYVLGASISNVVTLLAAMEALCGALKKTVPLEPAIPDDISNLRQYLLKAAADFPSPDPHRHEELVNLVEPRLNALGQDGTTARLARVFDHYNLGPEIIWGGKYLSAKTVIADAWRRRNDYVHGGTLPTKAEMHRDYAIVHALLERLIYSLLGGRQEWLAKWANTGVMGYGAFSP
jgi:hypothetical protein